MADFTGIDSPYEAPTNPEIVMKTGETSIDECSQKLVDLLVERVSYFFNSARFTLSMIDLSERRPLSIRVKLVIIHDLSNQISPFRPSLLMRFQTS